jgi:hypothetical protein
LWLSDAPVHSHLRLSLPIKHIASHAGLGAVPTKITSMMVVEPRLDFLLELLLDDAVQMAGVSYLDDRPILLDRLERRDIEVHERVAVAD